MSYSRSKDAVKPVENYLLTLADATESVTWLTADPQTLSYLLRQAFHVSTLYPETFPTFKDLKARFTIKVLPGKVTAKLRAPTGVVDTSPTVDTFLKTVDRLEVPNVVTVMQIVGAAIKNKQYEELLFPDASPSDEDMPKLYAWTQKNGYHIIFTQTNLTLTKREAGELAWKP